MSDLDGLWAIFDADMIPSVAARIPVKVLETVVGRLTEVSEERAGVMDGQHRHGYVEGRHDLVRELGEIIKRELAPAADLYEKLEGLDG